MKMLYNRAVCTPRRCMVICTPSPQSIRNDLSQSERICPEGELVFVGLALPQPRMVKEASIANGERDVAYR